MNPTAKKVGKYVLYELLAKGGMAEVYRGKMVGVGGFEKRVAIKRILSDFATSAEFQRMFLSEAKVMSSLEHANIVQVLDFFREGDELFLVMDFIFGRNLRQILKRSQETKTAMPIPIVLYLLSKTSDALDYAHRKIDERGKSLGIIHRDVSPQNIMISFDGEVRIVDFGIAKLATNAEKTQTGVLKGKFGYMSPEQVEGLTLDYRSDIFSLGVVLYECLAGRKLFQAETDVQIIKLIQTFRTPHIAADRPEVTEELEKVMQKALEKDRVKRYQSALEVSDALNEILMKEYGGCNAFRCAEFIKRLFQEEYQAALQMMRAQAEVVAIADPASHTQIQERSALLATGTQGEMTTTPLREKKSGESTLIKLNPEHIGSYHSFELGSGIRFKIELDPGKPWEKAQPALSTEAVAATIGAQKRKSLLLRLWKDPRKRKWLLIGGVLLVAALFLLPKPEESPQDLEKEKTTQKVLEQVNQELQPDADPNRKPTSEENVPEETQNQEAEMAQPPASESEAAPVQPQDMVPEPGPEENSL